MVLSGVINKKTHNIVRYYNLNVAAAFVFYPHIKYQPYFFIGSAMHTCMKGRLVKFISSNNFLPLLYFRYFELRVLGQGRNCFTSYDINIYQRKITGCLLTIIYEGIIKIIPVKTRFFQFPKFSLAHHRQWRPLLITF